MRFVEQDRDQHRAVIDAKGKESRGTGNAAATITALLNADGEHTNVTVDTDLKIVGKLAQFGSGMLQQVSEKLLGQFVESLEAELVAKNTETPPPPESSAETERVPAPRRAPAAEPEPIDLLQLAGGDRLKKYGAVAAAALAALVLIWVLRRRR